MKNKKIKFNSNNGITLIALVITIIILIILAGITISIALEKNGILGRSKEGKEQYTIEAIREKLDEIKGSDYIEKVGDSTIDTYIETLDKEKIEPYNVTKKEKISDSVAIIEVDNKYSYIIKIDSKDEIKIEYEGKIEEIDRTEPLIEINISGDNIQTELPIKLTAIVTSNGENINQPIWKLNTIGEDFGTDEEKYNKAENENIDIEMGEVNTYYLHVLTIDQYGRKQETIKGPITIEEKYHEHTGSSTTGGGCYTSTIYHKHVSSCYTTTQQAYQASIRYDGQTYGDGTWYRRGFCSVCGTQLFQAGSSGGWGSETPHTHYKDVQTLTCKKTENSTIDGYNLGCGKTTSTFENYSISIE